MVVGKQGLLMKNLFLLPEKTELLSTTVSAAAEASSNKLALDTYKPVNSVINV
jgi:hypothetical protein